MKISININGRNVDFSQEDLFLKLKELEELNTHFMCEETNTDTLHEIAIKPMENKYFKVTPAYINQNLFKYERNDFMQEWTRKAILQALREVKRRPRKYFRTFETFMPKKSWQSKTVEELISIANIRGNHIADWVEQSLEWAQRINNGETWQTVCNKPDTANWYRLIMWKKNNVKIVGGSYMCKDALSAVTVFGNHSELNDVLHFTVPLIVTYEV